MSTGRLKTIKGEYYVNLLTNYEAHVHRLPKGPIMIRIVGYGRKSTREQAEKGFNLDEQERRINEYVDLYYAEEDIEYSLVREGGASARSLKRPKMNVLLDKIRHDEVDVLIVHNLDRLTRNLVDMQQLLELFEEKHVQLVSLKEHVDTTTPQPQLFFHRIPHFINQVFFSISSAAAILTMETLL